MTTEKVSGRPKWSAHYTVASILLVVGVFAVAVAGTYAGSTITRNTAGTLVAQETFVAADVSYLLTTNGELFSQGLNNYGQLGLGNLDDSPAWARVVFNPKGAEPTIAKISTQGEHVLALDAAGGLWTWGSGANSALGNGSNNPVIRPRKISVSYSFSQIQAGDNFVLALDPRGVLYSWGQNTQGQLGTGDNNPVAGPTIIETSARFKSISAGKNFAFALDSNGALWAWGSNDGGQFGNGTKTGSNVPVQVSSGPWTSVTASRFSNTVVAIDSNGALWSWGSNGHALLGTGTDWRADQAAETQRVADEITAIQAKDATARQVMSDQLTAAKLADMHTSWQTKANAWAVANPTPKASDFPALTDPDGSLFKAAQATWTQAKATWLAANPEPLTADALAASDKAAIEAQVTKDFVPTDTSKLVAATIAEPSIGGDSLTPVKNPVTAKFSSVSIGSENAFALDSQGHLWAWGNDKNGQTGLGLDESTHTHRPVMVSSDTYTSVFAGDRWATAVGSGAYTWGLNSKANPLQSDQSKLLAPTKIAGGAFTKVSGSSATAAAIKSDGTALTWGANAAGLAGQNVAKDSVSAAVITGKFKAIAFAQAGVVALTPGVGDLYFWGSDKDRLSAADKQITANTLAPLAHSITKFIDIAAGRLSSTVVDLNGFVWTWGLSWMGSLANSAQTIPLPTQVPLDAKVTKIVASQTNVMFLTDKNELSWWGSDTPGGAITSVKLPKGIKLAPVEELASGKHHFLIRDKTGAVYSLLTQSSPARATEQEVGVLTPIKLPGKAQSITAGNNASLAIVSGVAYGWGDNVPRELLMNSKLGYIGEPEKMAAPYADKWSKISLSSTHALGITNAGALYGWGYSKYVDGLSNHNLTKPVYLAINVKDQ